MVTDQAASKIGELVLELLADGEWHGHRKLVGDLTRTPLSEYAIRSALRGLRSAPEIEVESRRASYRHSPSWWYRLRGSE